MISRIKHIFEDLIVGIAFASPMWVAAIVDHFMWS